MVSLGQKLKMPKRCEKRLYEHIRTVVCKKALQKTPNTQKMRAFYKWPKLATTQGLYPLQNGQFRSKIKNAKKIPNTIVEHIRVNVCKKALQKRSTIRKLRAF